MMPALTLANLVIYFVQVAVLTVVGACLPIVFRLSAPRARMAYYRLLLLVALALPLLRPVATPDPLPPIVRLASLEVDAQMASLPSLIASGRSAPAARWGSPADFSRLAVTSVAAVVMAGLVARLVWVALGFRLLWRLRRSAVALEPRPEPVQQAVGLTAADADIRLSDEIAHPVSFGAARPAILLPRCLRAFPDEEQRAVACHELIHVRRHDWLRTVSDELMRTAFWFHPAVWWLLDRIHLAREQTVDQEVVEITGSRRPYLDALIKLARPATRPTPRPVSLFLRRAHLPERIALLLREVSMSRTRLVGGLAACITTMLAVGWLAQSALPLHAAPATLSTVTAVTTDQQVTKPGATAAGQQATKPGATAPGQQTTKPGTTAPGQQAAKPGVQTARPLPHLIHQVRPVYPPVALAARVQGVVILEARIGPAGEVLDARILRSIPLLDQAAIDAVRQWRFEPPGVEVKTTLTVAFKLDDQPQGVAGGVEGGVQGGVSGGVPAGVAKGAAGAIARTTSARLPKKAARVYPPAVNATGIEAIAIVSVKIDETGRVIDARGVGGSPALWDAAVDAVRQWDFGAGDGEAELMLGFNLAADSPIPATPADPRIPAPPADPLRVGGNIRQPSKTTDVRPVYPDDAKAAGIAGVVIIEAVIAPSGRVAEALVLRSIPGLDAAALESVLQWKFTPTLLNGVAVPVIMTVTVNFTLS